MSKQGKGSIWIDSLQRNTDTHTIDACLIVQNSSVSYRIVRDLHAVIIELESFERKFRDMAGEICVTGCFTSIMGGIHKQRKRNQKSGQGRGLTNLQIMKPAAECFHFGCGGCWLSFYLLAE